MKKKTFLMTIDSLNGLGKCFADPEEVKHFDEQLLDMVDEIYFYYQMRARVKNTEDNATVMLKQVAFLTLFFRDNMELIHQLVSRCEARELTEDETNSQLGE